MAFRITRQERPFAIEAFVILPDHLHAIWALPSGDSDFSGRWKRIKAYSTHRLVTAGVAVKRHCNGDYALWQRLTRQRNLGKASLTRMEHSEIGTRHQPSPGYASLHPGYEG